MHRRTALAALALPLAASAQTAVAPPVINKVEVGTLLPEFDAEWAGPARPAGASRLMLIDFWATWCAPCLEHFPFLNLLAQGYASSGVEVLAMTKEPGSTVLPFLSSRPVKFHVGYGGSRQLQERLKVNALPYSLLVGADRKVLWSGYPNAKLPLLIEQALKPA